MARRSSLPRPATDGTRSSIRNRGWLLGTLAGLAWLAITLRGLLAPEAAFSTRPLCHLTWGNMALLAAPRNEPLALRLPGQPNGRGESEHRVALRLPVYSGPELAPVPSGWARDHQLPGEDFRSIDLYFEVQAGAHAPWQTPTPLGLIEGRLVLPDGRVLEARQPSTARSGSLVEFHLTPRAPGSLAPGELYLRTTGSKTLFLRGVVRVLGNGRAEEKSPPLGRLAISLPSAPGSASRIHDGKVFYPDGRVTAQVPGKREARGTLLARLHDVPEAVLFGVVVAAALVIGLGSCLVHHGIAATRRAAGFLGFGVAQLVLGLGASYAVLIVPMQGPDEAVHALSFARLRADGRALHEMVAAGRAAHWDGLRWRPDLKISARHADAPDVFFLPEEYLRPPTVDQQIPDYHRRAPLVARFWKVAAMLAPTPTGCRALFVLRLAQAGFAALLIGLGAFAVASVLEADGARWILVGPLLLPALPPLLACVSNYSELVAASTLVAGTVLRQAIRFDAHWRWALLQGVAMGLLVASGTGSLAVLGGMTVWLGHRPVLRALGVGYAGEPPGSSGILRWWTALAAGFLASGLFLTEGYLAEIRGHVHRAMPGSEPWLLLADPRCLWTVACLAWGALEAGLLQRGQDTGGTGFPRVFVTASAWLLALALVAWAGITVVAATGGAWTFPDLESPWRQFPGVPNSGCPLFTVEEFDLPALSSTLPEHLKLLGKVVVSNLSPWPRDFILVRSFWAGMLGCEVRVPAWLVTMASGFFLGGVVAGLGTLAFHGSPRRHAVAWMGFLAVGVALLAITIAYWPRNLYGRYAMPLLLFPLGAGYLGWIPVLRTVFRRAPFALSAILLGALLGLHAGGWLAMQARFF